MVQQYTKILVWAVARDGRIYGISAPIRTGKKYNTLPTSVRLSNNRRLLVVKAGSELLPLPVSVIREVYFTRGADGKEALSYVDVSAKHGDTEITVRMRDKRKATWLTTENPS